MLMQFALVKLCPSVVITVFGGSKAITLKLLTCFVKWVNLYSLLRVVEHTVGVALELCGVRVLETGL
jgi:hypothetical protein